MAERADASSFVCNPFYRQRETKLGRQEREPITHPKTAHTFVTAEATQHECPFCPKKMHKATQCTKFEKLSTDERWQLAKKKSLCFRCLQSGHGSRSCKMKTKCGVHDCSRFLHLLLHRATESSVEYMLIPQKEKLHKSCCA